MISSPNYSKCVICGEPRMKRVHAKCSRKLQKMSSDPKLIAERKLIKEGERKYLASERSAHELTCKVTAMTKK